MTMFIQAFVYIYVPPAITNNILSRFSLDSEVNFSEFMGNLEKKIYYMHGDVFTRSKSSNAYFCVTHL